MLNAALSRNHRSNRSYLSYRSFLNKKPEAFDRAIELFQIKWFAEIHIAAGFERGFFHAINVVRGDGDDRCVDALAFEPAKLSDGLQTIKNRHVKVDDEQVRPEAPSHIKRLLTVFGFKNTVSF